jgi:hypothetical protein
MSGEHLNFKGIQFSRRDRIANPARLVRLIRDTISFLELDLSGLTVLTEAASGPFVVTPIIALLAGAKRVIALTGDSNYASAEEVIAQTRALEQFCHPKAEIEIHTERSLSIFSQADIVTNLGFVRPIDNQAVAAMKPGAVVPLMCEAWEFRPGDVDLEACRQKGISVFGTNEDYPGLEVFSYSGWLCLKMLFEAQIEVYKNRIIVVSSDKFGTVIERLLSRSGVDVRLVPNLLDVSEEQLASADVLVVADYTREDVIIGTGGDITSEELSRLTQGITIVQFAGRVDTHGLADNGIMLYPGKTLDPHRMAMTLAVLGPRPVIELHAAGLKVGEMAARRPQGSLSLSALPGQPSLLQEVNPRTS